MTPDLQPDPKTAHNEKVKATAAYLNGIAGAVFTAGVIAPVIATAFGVVGTFAPVSALTLVLGVAISFGASLVAHYAARRILDRISK